MVRVIIESPYRGDIVKNTAYAQKAMLDCLKRGESPFASHLLYTQVLNEDDHNERQLGMEAGWEWFGSVDKVVVYMDHDISSGMQEGINKAKQMGISVEYRWLTQVGMKS